MLQVMHLNGLRRVALGLACATAVVGALFVAYVLIGSRSDAEGGDVAAAPPVSSARGDQQPTPIPREVASETQSATATSKPASRESSSWLATRQRFGSDPNLAQAIHDALARPTAAGIFYSLRTLSQCDSARALGLLRTDGSSFAVDVKADERVRAFATKCADALTYHEGWGTVYRKQYNLPMAVDERHVLDAIEGRGEFARSQLSTRIAVAAATGDSLAIAAVGEAWAQRTDATYAGTTLSTEDAAAFASAWALISCMEAGNCDTSTGSLRLCAHSGRCEGSLQSRLESTMTVDEVERFHRALDAVQRAVSSGNLSAFGP